MQLQPIHVVYFNIACWLLSLVCEIEARTFSCSYCHCCSGRQYKASVDRVCWLRRRFSQVFETSHGCRL